MAIDLTAVFRITDRGTSQMRNITRGMSSMQSQVLGLVGAFATAAGAVKAFHETVGRAAQLEASTVAIDAIFNDKQASAEYMDMVKKMSLNSPVLSQTDMLSSSKGLIAMTKNVDELTDAWQIAEKLMVLDPTQGTDGAAFALKEMWQGDSLSMVERFGLNKADLNRIKKLDIPSQITEINKLLDTMGITSDAVEKMGQTSMASWGGVKERYEAFMQVVGGEGNKTMGKFYQRLSSIFDSDGAAAFANRLGDGLNTVLTKVIDIGTWLWKWREPVLYIVGAVTAALGAFALIGTIALLYNPIALIAGAVAAVAVGFKALYDSSEPVQNVVRGIGEQVATLFNAFKTGGAGGLLSALLGEGATNKLAEIVNFAKSKLAEMQSGFTVVKDALTQGWATLTDVFANAWTIIQPVLSGLWSLIKIAGEVAIIAFNGVIAPALSFIMQLFTTLWAIAKPILTLLAGLFEVVAAAVATLWKNVMIPIMEFIYGAFTNAFENLSGVLEIVAGWFDSLSGFVSTAKDKLSQFADFLSGIKLPDWITNGISTTVSFVGDVISANGGEGGKSHYHGLDNVPYDGYMIRAHKNEQLLTAQESKEYKATKGGSGGLGGVTIAKLADQIIVREEADIDRFANAFARKIEQKIFIGGY